MSSYISLNFHSSIDVEDETTENVQKISETEVAGIVIDHGAGCAFHRISEFLKRKAIEIGDR